MLAIPRAAAICISSVMSLARASKAPRKIPGNAKTLLIWLGKSLRPVATINAPPSLASSGIISGVGFAIAKIIAFSFIVWIHSFLKTFGADTPIKTSASFTTSSNEPFKWSGFEIEANSLWRSCNSGSSSEIAPSISHTITFFAPAWIIFLAIAVPAEPPPLITIFTSSIVFSATFSALIKPAKTTIAVPCWSSWKTGISNSSFRRRSISKQRGAAISSKLIPPNDGAKALTCEIISSTSCVSNEIGTASTSALINTDFLSNTWVITLLFIAFRD